MHSRIFEHSFPSLKKVKLSVWSDGYHCTGVDHMLNSTKYLESIDLEDSVGCHERTQIIDLLDKQDALKQVKLNLRIENAVSAMTDLKTQILQSQHMELQSF